MPLWRNRRRKTETGKAPGLIFAWERRRGFAARAGAFVFLSVLLHGLGFYLFQVVYPSPVRVEPATGRIQVLDPSDALARSVLQRARDRIVYLRPPSARSRAREDLEDHQVRFTPSFQSIGPRFLAPTEDAPGLESLFSLERVDSDPPATIGFRLSENLAQRGVAPWSILGDYLSLAESVPPFRAELSVTPSGGIADVVVTTDLGEEAKRELARVIASTLRFYERESTEPAGSSETTQTTQTTESAARDGEGGGKGDDRGWIEVGVGRG